MKTNQDYHEYDFHLSVIEPWRDLLISDLGEAGMESFEETADGFKAYAAEELANISTILDAYASHTAIDWKKTTVENQNWNKKWESSFTPVIVNDRCAIKATFHSLPNSYEYVITINPKMSFGTGHHQTTYMMIEHLLEIDVRNHRVLDMGSGTGVLAILAWMEGAQKVTAIDIDEWAYVNCLENFKLNGLLKGVVEKGDVSLLAGRTFNTILANINKNVLLADIPKYVKSLEDNGNLVISGFYRKEIEELNRCAGISGLQPIEVKTREEWASVRYVKE